MQRTLLNHFLISSALLCSSLTAGVDYKKDIKPIFEKRCVECHSMKMKKPKGGYKFDDDSSIKNEIGPSFLIRPGDAGNSDLMGMVTRANKDHPMPPDKGDALNAREIKLLRDWIDSGASMDSGSSSGTSSLPTRTAPTEQAWTNKDGKIIKAVFVKILGDKLTLKMGNKNYELPLNSLSEDSQKLALKTAGEMTVKPR